MISYHRHQDWYYASRISSTDANTVLGFASNTSTDRLWCAQVGTTHHLFVPPPFLPSLIMTCAVTWYGRLHPATQHVCRWLPVTFSYFSFYRGILYCGLSLLPVPLMFWHWVDVENFNGISREVLSSGAWETGKIQNLGDWKFEGLILLAPTARLGCDDTKRVFTGFISRGNSNPYLEVKFRVYTWHGIWLFTGFP